MLHAAENSEKILEVLKKDERFKQNKEIASLLKHKIHTDYHSPYQASIEVPKYAIPEKGVDEEAAFRFVQDHMTLDGKPTLNFASFVNTHANDYLRRLADAHLTKNLADSDEYPGLVDLHSRCISMLSDLWNAPKGNKAMGSATTGSSESILLGGLAMKQAWKEKRKAQGKDFSNPNYIVGSNCHCSIEKFGRYFDVEARLVPVSKESNYVLDVSKIPDLLDENTIGVYVILGSTYTGHFEDVTAVSKILDDFEAKSGHSVPIHVDAASGGFMAPFVYPELPWDFRNPRVKSINTSGHKFGLTTAGLGWVVWRDQSELPEYLIFELAYLGSVQQSFTLNFSRPGFEVVQQYYLLVSLGREGYKYIHESALENARVLSRFLEYTGWFTVLSNIHRKRGHNESNPLHPYVSSETEDYNYGLPVVSFAFSDSFKETYPHIKQAYLSEALRSAGFIAPNYPLAPNAQDQEVIRIVVRQSATSDLLQALMENIVRLTGHVIDVSKHDGFGTPSAIASLGPKKDRSQKHHHGVC